MVDRVLHDRYRLPAHFIGGLSSSPDALSALKPHALRHLFGPVNIHDEDPESGGFHGLSDAAKLVDHLRLERYVGRAGRQSWRVGEYAVVRRAYYAMRPLMSAQLRRLIQRVYLSDWKTLPFPEWPVDSTVDLLHDELLRQWMKAAGIRRVPFIWFWPDGASSCLIMTHDVETSCGMDHVSALMDLDAAYGIRASFQLIPEGRYETPEGRVREIRSRGFECNIHDMNHDGRLFDDHEEFLRRAKRINEHAQRYGARGFRSACMYRNQEWFEALQFSYDMTVPNVAHLDPQRGGCCTVMPYFIGDLIELPLTTTQDYSLFHILRAYSLDLWKEQVDLICRRNGLISFNSHPDYIVESRPRRTYESLLAYLRQKIDRENIWAALPGDVETWWRARSQMSLKDRGSHWEIIGAGSERARLAHAVLDDADCLSYEIGSATRPAEESRVPGPGLPLAQ